MSLSRTLVLRKVTIAVDDALALLSSLDHRLVRYLYGSTGVTGDGLCWYNNQESRPNLIASHFTTSIEKFRKILTGAPVAKLTVSGGADMRSIPSLCYQRNGIVTDVTPAGVNKASGARAVMEHLQVDLRRSMFIFNDKNDLPIIEDPYFADLIRVKVGPALPTVACDFLAACPEDVSFVFRAFSLNDA